METLNLYQNNVAYDFEMFAPKPKTEPSPVIDYPVKEQREKVRRQRNANAKTSKVTRVVMVGALLLAIFANIFSYAEINRVETTITKQNKSIAKLDSEISRLECNLQSLMNYDTIEEGAKELGMQKLERSQIVYLNVNQAEIENDENS